MAWDIGAYEFTSARHWAKILVANPANIATDDYCKLTANDVIGRSYTEVKEDLDLEIGTDLQAWDTGLDSLAALTYVSDSFIKVTAEDTYAIRTLAEVKTDLSLNLVENTAISTWVGTTNITTLGTIATGTWQATDVGIAYGGTGQSTAQLAINALSAVSGATNEHVLTKDTGTGNALWKATGGGVAAHAILDGSIHTDSVADAVTRGSIIYGNATPKWDELVVGVADTFLGSDGTDISYRTAAQMMASLSGEGAAAFDLNGQDLTNGGVLFLTEQAAAEAHVAAKGQFWVKTATPNEPYFDNDVGTEIPLDNRYVDRGDPVATDWDEGDLTADGTYYDLDLSGIVPSNAVVINILGRVEDDVVDVSMSLRKNGNVNTGASTVIKTLIADKSNYQTMIVACDANQVIEYRLSNNVFTRARITILGWWLA